MNATNRTDDDRDALLETFAAELAGAAYRTALRHGAGGTWVDLELDLWRALIEAVKKWDGDSAGRDRLPQGASFPVEAPRPLVDDFTHVVGGG